MNWSSSDVHPSNCTKTITLLQPVKLKGVLVPIITAKDNKYLTQTINRPVCVTDHQGSTINSLESNFFFYYKHGTMLICTKASK